MKASLVLLLLGALTLSVFAQDQTILQYLASQPDKFTVLAIAASTVDGLFDLLNDTDASLTLFPPTDAAFFDLATAIAPDAPLEASDKAAIADAIVAAVAPLANLPEAKNSTLASILSYHLVPEALSFEELEAANGITTAQGDDLRVIRGAVIDLDTSRPNPIANPVDFKTTNGYIHTIDAVLLPFNLLNAAAAIPAVSPGPEDPSPAPESAGVGSDEAKGIPDAVILDPRPTIVEYLVSMPDKFGVLARAAASVPGLLGTLGDANTRYTLFPPTDTAFLKLAKILAPDTALTVDDKDGITDVLVGAIAPLAENADAKFSTITSILQYHLLADAYPIQKLEAGRTAMTVQGDSLKFANGRVIDADPSRRNPSPKPRNVLTLNGWVHVIDSVLLPFDLSALVAMPSPTPEDGGAIDLSEAEEIPDATILEPRTTILKYLVSRPKKFAILTMAAGVFPGLVKKLDDPSQRLTVFPPTDTAFYNLAKRLAPNSKVDVNDKDAITRVLTAAIAPLANVSEAKSSTLRSILQYHVLGDALPFQKLESEGMFDTLQGDELKFAKGQVIDGDRSRSNPAPRPRNVFALNGWVHTVDIVLLPFNLGKVIGSETEEPEPTPSGPEDGEGLPLSAAEGVNNATILQPRITILEYLLSLPKEFGILARAAGLVEGITDVLGNESERLTLFAPTDEAFARLANQLTNENLAPSQKDEVLAALGSAIESLVDLPEADNITLGAILTYHLLEEALSFPELRTDGSAETAQGESLTIKGISVIDVDESRENASAFRRNIFALNGWVHVIDSVLLPLNLGEDMQGSPQPSPEETPGTESEDGGAGPIVSNGDDDDDDDDDDAVCFPGTSTVRLSDGSTVQMASLRAGHAVHVGAGQTSKVFAFTHKTTSHQGYFRELTTASGHSVTMTAGHYVYANGALTAASAVRVGDVLQTATGKSPVVTVRVREATGLYAPHTLHGDIEVNGIIVSGYSRTLNPTIAHALLAPVRAFSKYAGVEEPLGSLFYDGADRIAHLLPKGLNRY